MERKSPDACRCDADPTALANYIIALLERDQPWEELHASCLEKLEEFLDKRRVCYAASLLQRHAPFAQTHVLSWMTSSVI